MIHPGQFMHRFFGVLASLASGISLDSRIPPGGAARPSVPLGLKYIWSKMIKWLKNCFV